MHVTKNFILKRNGQKPLIIDHFYSEENKRQPIVIFCHGYKGFKDWGAWHLMAKHIANAGFCFVKFNFSHNGGTIEQPIDFPDLKAFANNNYSKELDDLGDIIDWSISNFENNPLIDTSKIYLIGHSRGGGIVLLKTAEDSRINKVITLASVCDFGQRSSTISDLEQWKKDGVKYVTNGRTKQEMPHYIQFYEDYIQNKKRLDIQSATKHIIIPQLIVHGDADTSISIDEAEKIHCWNPKSKLEIVKNADHVFNVKHPWKAKNLPLEFKSMLNSVTNFLKVS